MKPLRLSVALAVFLVCIFAMFAITAQSPEAVIVVEAISLQDIANNGWTTPPFYRSSGLKNVGKGQLVYLSGQEASDEEVTAYAWSLTSIPPGSQATLDSTTTQHTTFRPDTTGQFVVQLSITTASGMADTTVTINSALYVGVGGMPGLPAPDIAKGQCGACHNGTVQPDKLTEWLGTRHASKFQRDIDGGVSFYSETCLQCHTVGYDTTAVNAGFDDLAKQQGWTIPDTLQPGNWDSMTANFPDVAQKANIQCEMCHGPGSAHFGNKANIDLSLSDGVCGQCHDDLTHHPKGTQWRNSRHAIGVSFAAGRTPCNQCHSGYGFIDRMEGEMELRTGFQQISCPVCHDPHSAENEHQVRSEADVTLTNGEVISFGGIAKLCMQCHHARENAETYSAEYHDRFGPHHNPQADMLAGTNAITFGLDLPTSNHKGAVEEACVQCHMADTPAEGEPGHNRVGEHTFAVHDPVDDVDNVSACQPCHNIASFDDFRAGFDYDEDGTIESVQAEIKGLMDELGTLLPPFGDTAVVFDTTQFSPETYTPLILKTAYNYMFVLEDGSYGVHNFKYALNLLKTSIDTLKGTPVSVATPGAETIPEQYALLQNYPNPFNPTTTIPFNLRKSGHVTLTLYNVLGKEAMKIIDRDMEAGDHSVVVDSNNLASGVYFYQIRVNDFIAMKKMVLMK